MLEQTLYQSPRISEKKKIVYQIGDLESLSASALYSGHLPPMGPGGFGKDFGLKIGYVFDTLNVGGVEIQMRLRADEGHKGCEIPHLNLESYEKGKTKPFLNDHILLDWKE